MSIDTQQARHAELSRETKETQIQLRLCIDGRGESELSTPVPFINHMLDAFCKHGLFDLRVEARGDMEIDAHHTIEDLGLCLGDAFKQALADGSGINRYGHFTLPMDETLVGCAVDFCGRPAFVWNVDEIRGRWIGQYDCDLTKEFFAAFASRAACNLHINLHYGENAHHIIEAIFKAFAKATDMATTVDPRKLGVIPSTKGTLSR